MENSIEEDMKIVEDYLENSAINETDSNFFKNGGWETVDLEIPKSMQHILSDYKRVLKENEELKQEKINNYRMIALAQNEALGYMQGYEDGKKIKTSAIASIVENQQYYIIKKQMEKYEEHIAKLQKENEELKSNNEKYIIHLTDEQYKTVIENAQNDINQKWIQKVKDKIEKEIKYHEKNILDIENITMLKGKTAKEEAEIEFNKYAIVVLKKMLQELLEGRE